jgi:serine/threonine protein kinase
MCCRITMSVEETIGDYVVLKDDESDLGSGTSGSVFMAEHATSGHVVAAKRMKLSLDPIYGEEHNRKYVFNELKILKTLNHRNVIKLYNSERKGKYIYLFLELCEKGDLNKFIEKERVLTREVAFRFLVHISEALVYLHGHEPVIIHRDVKPDNLLVQGDDDQNYVIKITDFAFSKQAPNAAAEVSTTVGSQNWMAPEVQPDKDGRVSYNIEADVFSAGLVFLAILDHEEGKFFIAFKGMCNCCSTKCPSISWELCLTVIGQRLSIPFPGFICSHESCKCHRAASAECDTAMTE